MARQSTLTDAGTDTQTTLSGLAADTAVLALYALAVVVGSGAVVGATTGLEAGLVRGVLAATLAGATAGVAGVLAGR